MKKAKKFLVVFGVTLFAALGIATAVFMNPGTPIWLAQKGSLPDYSLDDMKKNATIVASGTVQDVSPAFIVEANNGSIGIFRDCTFRIEHLLRGETETEEITVRISGGTVDRIKMTDDTSAELYEGQNYLLFLYWPGIGGDTQTDEDYYRIMGGVLGAYKNTTSRDVALKKIANEEIQNLFQDETDQLYLSCLQTENENLQSAMEFISENKSARKEFLLSFNQLEREMEELNKKVPVNEHWFRDDVYKSLKSNLENEMITQEEYDQYIADLDVYGTVADNERTKEIVKRYTK